MPRSPSLSEQIFNYAMRYAAPFASELGHAWAAIPAGPLTHEPLSLTSSRFREWLAHGFHHEHGIFPTPHSLRHAISLLQAHARFSARPRQEIFTRIGWRGDPLCPRSVLIDLANPDREIVEIDRESWRLHSNDGSRFRLSPGARPLPRPQRHSAPPFERLQSVLNLNASSPAYRRMLSWLFAALRPTGPYPVLILTGPPCSGKSTAARILRGLLDPAAAPFDALPQTERELFFLALHNRVLAFDRVSRLSPAISTALARVSTGTAFTHRGPHLSDPSLRFPIERPVILTVPYADSAAPNWTRHGALANLAIAVDLQAISSQRMRPRSEVLRDFDTAAPHILSDLCNAVSAALADSTATVAPLSGRPAEIHRWIANAAPALGLTLEDVNSALSADPLVRVLTSLLGQDGDGHGDQGGEWTGSAAELLQILQNNAVPDLPATPKGLSQRLHKMPLAIFGITLTHRLTHEDRLLKIAATHRSYDASPEKQLCVAN